MTPVYVSTAEAAELLGVTPETVRRWVRAGTIRAVTVGRRVRIAEAELERVYGEGSYFDFLSTVHNELRLHSPADGICQSCGDPFPCDTITEIARRLEVKV